MADVNIPKRKKPSESAFKQQRLPAWQPILTARTVLPAFFVIGIAFIPIGISLLYTSDKIKEYVVDYTECTNIDQPGVKCYDFMKTNPDETCHCQVRFNIDTDIPAEVYMYYGLSNFYQNHRRYVKSRDDDQLLGKLDKEPSSDCAPFAKTSNGVAIVPCGAIANSMFSDELWILNSGQQQVPLLRTGIAWESDKKIKFKNPPGDLQTALQNFSKPKAWRKNLWELDKEDPSNNGLQNEDFIVWMRTAALPTFRKLYRRIDHSKDGFKAGLSKGNYTLMVNYYFDVSSFGGTKKMILSNTSSLGGKNSFLGIAYITVGTICLVLGVVLIVVHIKFGKSSADIINVNPRSSYR